MVDIKDLRPGMKVKIVDQPTQNWPDCYDRWFGKILTVWEINNDGCCHFWEPYMLGYIGWWWPADMDHIATEEEIRAHAAPPDEERVFQKYRCYYVAIKNGGRFFIPAVSREDAMAHFPKGTKFLAVQDITGYFNVSQELLNRAMYLGGISDKNRELILRVLNDLGFLSVDPRADTRIYNPGYIARVPVRRKS